MNVAQLSPVTLAQDPPPPPPGLAISILLFSEIIQQLANNFFKKKFDTILSDISKKNGYKKSLACGKIKWLIPPPMPIPPHPTLYECISSHLWLNSMLVVKGLLPAAICVREW